ncbi:MAG: glycoside hydrolase family 16 protein [Bacteroidales bacterium]|nr:glycoside hydrolase family 16 protein [Bacteroidales bacterium]
MAGIRALLGLFPKTGDYESKLNTLDEEYKELMAVKNSKELHELHELEATVNSEEFIRKKKEILSLRFKQTDDYQKEQQYKKAAKSADIKLYYKVMNSSDLRNFERIAGSADLRTYNDLEEFVKSAEFLHLKKESKAKAFKASDEYVRFQDYLRLRKSKDIQFFEKYKKSKSLSNFNQLSGSDRLKQFEELEAYVKGDEFNKFKAYCLKPPRKRWMESKEFEILQDYELRKKSEKIVWYFKYAEHKRFDWHRRWTLTFKDEFSGPKLDKKIWLTRYYWGDKMFKGSYSLSQDKHFVTDGDNLLLENGRLHIVTKKEDIKGNSWDTSYGFISREFGYTSGLINSANSFRQKYGIFSAKVRLNAESKLINAFWMVGNSMVPHIDVVKAAKKISFSHAWGDPKDLKSVNKFSYKRGRKRLANDFYIFSLEWKPGKLSWSINGVEVASTTSGVPDEEMYIAFSAGLQTDVNGILPARMEIDWVRCYQLNELLEA